MAEENIAPSPLELAKRFNEAGHRGDIETCLSLIAEDVVVTDFHGPLDEPRVHRGPDQLLGYYGAFAQEFDDFDREIEEWVEADDWVIAVGRWVGTGKGSGARVEVRTASANRFRDGKVVECILGLPSKEAALTAAGLPASVMPDENAEVVRKAIDALNRRDLDAWLGFLSPDVEWGALPGVPGLGELYSGRAEVREWIEQLWELAEGGIHTEIEELTELGDDRVFLGIVLTARGRGSGVPFEMHAWELVWLGEGLVTRRQVFWTRDEALEAAGLRE